MVVRSWVKGSIFTLPMQVSWNQSSQTTHCQESVCLISVRRTLNFINLLISDAPAYLEHCCLLRLGVVVLLTPFANE